MSEPSDPTQSRVTANPAALPGVPEHELIRLIGSGSGGQVWLARNSQGIFRAVKIVYLSSFRHRRTFDREFSGILNFEPVSRLHEGLVDVLQVGRNDELGYFYCVMELADDVKSDKGFNPTDYRPRTLAQDLAGHKRLPIARCLEIGRQMAEALDFLHRHGLSHGDIKPSNIVFVKGIPKLADTGLVKEISDQTRSHAGTEGFIPPEGPGSAQGDIYALGKVLYEMSTGKDRYDYPGLPDGIKEFAEWRDLIQFNKIVVKACRANVNQRFPTVQDMLRALAAFQFCDINLEELRRRKMLRRSVGYVGLAVGCCVVAGMVWRLVWLLTHGN